MHILLHSCAFHTICEYFFVSCTPPHTRRSAGLGFVNFSCAASQINEISNCLIFVYAFFLLSFLFFSFVSLRLTEFFCVGPLQKMIQMRRNETHFSLHLFVFLLLILWPSLSVCRFVSLVIDRTAKMPTLVVQMMHVGCISVCVRATQALHKPAHTDARQTALAASLPLFRQAAQINCWMKLK